MYKKSVLLGALVLIIVAAVTVVYGCGGCGWTPNFGWGLGSLLASGKFKGYGNDNIVVRLNASGTAWASCQNPGGNIVPGHSPTPISVLAQGVFGSDSNGNSDVSVAAHEEAAAGSINPKDACPNGKWSVVGVVDRSADWTSATIEVYSAETGELLWSGNFTCETIFGPDTDGDGIRESIAVDCTPV